MFTIPFTGDTRRTVAIILLGLLVLGAAGLAYMIFIRRKEEEEAERLAAEEQAENEESDEPNAE